MSKHSQSLFKEAVLQIGAGGSAGFVEICIMHPLDLVKTRMQLQTVKPKDVLKSGSNDYYSGVFDCFRKMYRQEGLLSYYKGIVPPVLAETPKRALKFFSFEQYKKIFLFGAAAPTPLTFSLAGTCAGVTEAIFVNPFEVVKISLQSDKSKLKEYSSTWSRTREIIKVSGFGFNGLYKGLSGTIARNGVFNMVYLGFYHSALGWLPKFNDKVGEFLKKMTVGFVSGTLASCLNIPFDVAKSRIQGPQPIPNQIKYKKLFPSMALIYKEEGWRALYKGLLPKIMRLGPGGAIMLVVNDYATIFLRKKFLD